MNLQSLMAAKRSVMKNLSLVFLILMVYACQQPEKRKKNLLFILTDEQRYDTSAPYGNQLIKTPNLNKLGEESIVFLNAYVTQPVCSPARASILTGQYPHTHGVTTNNIPLDESIKTLPEYATNSDYKTGYIGKWHLGRETEPWHGFESRISIEDIYTTNDPSDYSKFLLNEGYTPDGKSNTFSRDFVSNLPFEHSKTKFVEAKAIEFIEENQQDPFILYLGFLEPHSPNNGPFNDLHDPSLITLDSTYYMDTPHDYPLRYFVKKSYSYDDSTQAVFAKYWGLVHQVDRSVGAILQRLKELGLEEETIVVFTSEHGKMMRKFGLTGKTVMYEPSSRIPLMIRIPGYEGKVIDTRVSQIELVPTLLGLLGESIPSVIQGKSLMPLIDGTAKEWRPVFMEWNPWQTGITDCPEWATEEDCIKASQSMTRSIVTQDGWKLNWSSGDRSQLFDLKNDPYEVINLYDDEEYRDKLSSLKEQIRDWQQKHNDQVNFNN